MKSSRIKLIELMEFLAVEIGRELAAQGHRLTGKLAASLQPRLTGQELTADMVWLAYGEAINNGVHRSRIPFSPGSGKKHSKYIAALIRYVKLRRLKPKNGQTVKSIAFAIAHSQKQTGLPTYASRRHSRTGRRTGAVQEALQRTRKAQATHVEEIGAAVINETLNEVLAAVAASPYIHITFN